VGERNIERDEEKYVESQDKCDKNFFGYYSKEKYIVAAKENSRKIPLFRMFGSFKKKKR